MTDPAPVRDIKAVTLARMRQVALGTLRALGAEYVDADGSGTEGPGGIAVTITPVPAVDPAEVDVILALPGKGGTGDTETRLPLAELLARLFATILDDPVPGLEDASRQGAGLAWDLGADRITIGYRVDAAPGPS